MRLIYNSASKEYVFKSPGTYQIRAKKEIGYKISGAQDQKQKSLEAEAITLNVSEATGVDKQVWKELSNPQMAKAFASSSVQKQSPELVEKLKRLLDQYPKSAYTKQIHALLGQTD